MELDVQQKYLRLQGKPEASLPLIVLADCLWRGNLADSFAPSVMSAIVTVVRSEPASETALCQFGAGSPTVAAEAAIAQLSSPVASYDFEPVEGTIYVRHHQQYKERLQVCTWN